MENIKIQATFKSPEISFDAKQGIFDIIGNSIPENTDRFYEPLLDWLKVYFQNPRENSTLNIKLFYINSASIRHILTLVELMDSFYKKDIKITVNWYYEEDDEDILDNGKLYQQMVKVPINLISYPVEY